MALTPRSGFSPSTSGPNDVENDLPNTQTDVLNNMPFISDTNLNKYAISNSSYPKVTDLLVGFIKGKRILVTYYRQLRQGGSNIRTNISDYPTTRNVIDTEYQKILNLEITLPSGFDFQSDPTKSSIGISGEAKFYPNMNPSVGDIFTTGVGDGRIGVFQISSVNRMSWRTDTIYTVKFVLQSFMDSSDSDPIEGSVTVVSVFSKANYLGSTAALLSEQTYLNLQKIKAVRSNLCKFYYSTFFNDSLNSYLRPDGVYDPHAVFFMSNKITMDDVHVRAKILIGFDQSEYKKTIWHRLEDRYNTTLNGVYPGFYLQTYRPNRLATYATELIGYDVTHPTHDPFSDDNYYVFSRDFYSNNQDQLSPFEKLIYTAITTRKAGDLNILITNYLDTVFSLSEDDMYYRIPLYIHLIDISLQTDYREIDAPSMDSFPNEG